MKIFFSLILLISCYCFVSAQSNHKNDIQPSATEADLEKIGNKNYSEKLTNQIDNCQIDGKPLSPKSAVTINVKSSEAKQFKDDISLNKNINFAFERPRPQLSAIRLNLNRSEPIDSSSINTPKSDESFRWLAALKQSLLFLGIQHGYALTQPKTRRDLKGKFFKDYLNSVKSLHGWGDGGRFFTNYVAHPMQGSFVGFIQIQNDPKGIKQRFGGSGAYWRSRMKALAWSAAWSTQFEIGPVSQASIGNVGLHGKQTWEDVINTPTIGIGMLITEDALDRFIIERIERSTNNFYITIFSRMLLNPTRTVANIFRFKNPWYRDRQRAR